MGNNIEFLDSIKAYLNKCFSMKDLGEAAYILGIKIYRDRSRRLIGLSQSTYLDKILKKFKMDQSKKGFLPVLQGVRLSKTQNPTTAEDRKRMKVIPYASAIGSIKYVMLCTRSIAYPVSILRIDKTFWLHHIQFFLKETIKECRFDVHLPYLIIVECGNC